MSPSHRHVAAAGMLLTQMPYGVYRRPAAPSRLARCLPALPDPLNYLSTRKPGAELGTGKREAPAKHRAFPSRLFQPPGRAHKQLRSRVLCSPGSAFLLEAFVPARLQQPQRSPRDPSGQGQLWGCQGSCQPGQGPPTLREKCPCSPRPPLVKGISFGMKAAARV